MIKNTVLFCFFSSIFMNMTSYLFYIKYSIYFCIFMFFPLFITMAWFLFKKEKNNISIFEEQKYNEILQWRKLLEVEKSILLVMAIVVIVLFIYLIRALEYSVMQANGSYSLMKKTQYIREATSAEYYLYMRRVCRLITGNFVLISYFLFLSIKYKPNCG